MPFLSTELAVRQSISKYDFFAQAIAWVKGIQGSQLFVNGEAIDLDNNTAVVTSDNNESLTLKHIEYMSGFVAGARHEILDDEGRIWRSEVVITNHSGKAFIRSKTQCIAENALAKIQVPQKPYFIKMAIDDSWVENDSDLSVSLDPKFLSNSDLELAARIVTGKFEGSLPVVYISRKDDNTIIFNERELRKFSLKIGGMAHVVVEPTRQFSIRLQRSASRKNPYNGSIAVCLQGYGVLRKYYVGRTHQSGTSILEDVYSYVIGIITNRRSSFGLEWSDIPEYLTDSLQGEIRKGSKELSAWLSSQEELLKEKELQISSLISSNETLQKRLMQQDVERSGILIPVLVSAAGKEIYPGEFDDRVRYILGLVKNSNLPDIDERTKELAGRVYNGTKFTGGANQILSRISQAGRDSATADARLGEILREIGFTKRQDGGHPVYTPADLFGTEQQTLSTSPSDHRSGRNSASRIANSLFIKNLT